MGRYVFYRSEIEDLNYVVVYVVDEVCYFSGEKYLVSVSLNVVISC